MSRYIKVYCLTGIYNYFINNDLSSKKTITPADDKVTAGKNGEKAIYITNDNGEKEIVYI